jgi:hypothetical protein
MQLDAQSETSKLSFAFPSQSNAARVSFVRGLISSMDTTIGSKLRA